MNGLMKKGLSVITAVFMMAACFAGIGDLKTYAAETEKEKGLGVYLSDNLNEPIKTFSLDELETIAANEGNKTYTYSGYNTFPTHKIQTNAKGPTVKGILEAAGVNFASDDIIKIKSGGDGVYVNFTGTQLAETRYFFPNGALGTSNGNEAMQESYAGKVEVPAIIDISQTDDEGVFKFGQVAPNEQNTASFIKYMLNDGQIIVGGKAEQWNPSVTIKDKNGKILGTDVEVGTEIYIDTSETNRNMKIYYSLDGSIPGNGSMIYNYSAYNTIIQPKFTQIGEVVLRIKLIGYGKLDSDVKSFEYKIVPTKPDPPKAPKAPKTPTSFKAARAGYGSIKLTWNKVSGASGYKIYRYNSSKKTYSNIKTLKGGSVKTYTNTGLKTGSKYYYKIRAYKTGEGGTSYSALSSSRSATPSLTKPTITKLTPGSKKITVRWNKISGATGYKLYRATSKNGKYKLVKTTKSRYYTNKSLKKNKRYYYKVRAYRIVDKKYKYSSYSTVKYTKAK